MAAAPAAAVAAAAPGAAAVEVALPVGEQLQGVCAEAVLIHQHVVVSRLVVALQTRVAVEEKVKLGGVADARVHDSARHAVARLVLVVSVCWEQACRVVLVDDHKRDWGAVAVLQVLAGPEGVCVGGGAGRTQKGQPRRGLVS